MRQHCTICEEETIWDDSKEFGDHDWCTQCGISKEMLEPLPGGCPNHPSSTHEEGYGFAAGGFSAYSICNECGSFFDVLQINDEGEA